ncbi:phycobilisome linker polypeptide [Microcoleus sp. FACHB-1515]|uniref:phycobilisome linker polypeptide n=1 Tax=Cyanophyceae TaxID=3028117 RepID=UPI0016896273|nr:phycobilisome linker polypeptide [Microcoleus sp. FACHB-1515]MBD2088517.1 phycobilisome linker polypeptide [Microcoleus sp. FACHB-1515]
MFGQTTVGTGGLSSDASRVFRFEVTGLRQNSVNDQNSYDIRRSGSVFLTVPYDRMSEEMQRIGRMGGKIVNIEPLTADSAKG